MNKPNDALGERAGAQNKLFFGVIRASDYKYRVVERDLIEFQGESLHVPPQESQGFSRGTLLLLDPLMELFEFDVSRLLLLTPGWWVF